jgi:hypothetical protein
MPDDKKKVKAKKPTKYDDVVKIDATFNDALKKIAAAGDKKK